MHVRSYTHRTAYATLAVVMADGGMLWRDSVGVAVGTFVAGVLAATYARSCAPPPCDGMGCFYYTTVSDVLRELEYDTRDARCTCCYGENECRLRAE